MKETEVSREQNGLPDHHRAMDKGGKSDARGFRYRRLRKFSIILMSIVALVPLIIMTAVNYYQYQKAMRADMIFPITRQTSNTRHALQSFIATRRSALDFVIRGSTYEELSNHDKLAELLDDLKTAFGGFIDLGLIDSRGNQVSYVGPYPLEGKNYRDQDWFHEVSIRGVYVSDVFKGYRGFPHFVIAIMHSTGDGRSYILRATLDSDMMYRDIISQNLRPSSDAFLVNRSGVLQTPSHFYGKVLDTISLAIPAYSPKTEVMEYTQGTKKLLMGYAFIEGAPFLLIETVEPASYMENWLSVRKQLLWFLFTSVVIILAVIIWGAYHMVGRIREADLKRTKMLHEIEYTNKMASIGRVAAGVAHEINNPMAIINENAGMIRDILTVTDNFPSREKIAKYVNSIVVSVDRVSKITHRLLGFAKRMDPQIELINLKDLIDEVLSFLGKEALHRNIAITYDFSPDLPEIESDRGQLQQVFLNIVTNAIEAVKDGGRINIDGKVRPDGRVDVLVHDDGPGISKEDLERIFEPFFTTKKAHGTGLGLSITYGIVQKLGGEIKVESTLGEGTTFIVTLPVARFEAGG